MRSSDMQRGFPPSAVVGWEPGQSFSCRWGQWWARYQPSWTQWERWVSSLTCSVLSTAHGVFPVQAEAGSPLHRIPWLSQSCWGCTSSPSPHDLLTLSKSPQKTCVFCSGELGSVTPPLQRSFIWLPEPIGSILGRIHGRQGMQCMAAYSHHHLSGQLKLLTMVIWTTLHIKQYPWQRSN